MPVDWLDRLGFSEAPVLEEEPVQEYNLNAAQVQELCRTNLDFLAATCMPIIFKYFFPHTFLSIWQWLLDRIHKVRDFSQLAIGLPRGFGKTMLIKLFIIYCILFTKRSFILVICGTRPKAINIISDIMMMLGESNIKKIFGYWRLGEINDKEDLKRFGFRGRNIIIAGAGKGSDIRGLTLNNERPDIMIFDDIQTREEANSETVSEGIETWMFGTAMKAKSPEGCLFIFVANMYPTKYAILKKLKQSPLWQKFIVGGILADGKSLWEDLQPIEQLVKEFENDLSIGQPEVFFSEVLNDENATVNHLIDISKLPPYPYQEDEVYTGDFIVIDPATDKKDSDAISIGYFRIFDTLPVLIEVEEGRYSPGETISRSLKMGLRNNCRFIAVESNAYQYSLLYWFGYICQQYAISGFQFEPVYSGIAAKNQRILEMFKKLRAKEQFYHPRTRVQVNAQITGFNPLRRDNTDGILDLLTYGPKVIELYGPVIVSMNIIEEQDYNKIPVRSVLETACF